MKAADYVLAENGEHLTRGPKPKVLAFNRNISGLEAKFRTGRFSTREFLLAATSFAEEHALGSDEPEEPVRNNK